MVEVVIDDITTVADPLGLPIINSAEQIGIWLSSQSQTSMQDRLYRLD